MEDKMMRPFCAPRQAIDRSSGARRIQLTEDDKESEEPTELRVVWEKYVIKETLQPSEDNGKGEAEPSPQFHRHACISEFEDYLAQLEAQPYPKAIVLEELRENVPSVASDGVVVETTLGQNRSWKFAADPIRMPPSAKMANAEWWEKVLQSDKQRLQDDANGRLVEVEEILLGGSSSDDDVPIVDSLPIVASLPKRKQKVRVTKRPKTLWTNEAVSEPTGVVFKYWDADAPAERTTKRVAKTRLSELRVATADSLGKSCISNLVQFTTNDDMYVPVTCQNSSSVLYSHNFTTYSSMVEPTNCKRQDTIHCGQW